jgi:branched-chain amino acid transport system substrate-binding protein
MRQIHRTLLMLLFVLCLSPAFGSEHGDDSRHSQRELRVGVLVSLTGSWNSLGIDTVAALQIAARKIETDAHSRGDDLKIHFYVYDTQLNPTLALQDIQELDRQGVNVIIGPQSSSEVSAIRTYADQHNIMVISQGSTASSLSIAGDNIFRMCPDDTREAAAIVALMWQNGIRTLVPMWRDDTGNQGLHDSVQTDFQNLGGTVTAGYMYEPTTTDFSAADAAIDLQVSEARAGASANTIGIYLAAFDEVTGIFDTAQADAVLSSTTWYGSDGVALIPQLIDDPVSAAFATTVSYPNPIFGLQTSLQSEWQPILNQIQTQTGIEPDAYALSTYDAMFIVDRAAREAGGTENFRAFKSDFVRVADSYTGITGSTALDAAGDRNAANFDFWEVQLQDSAYTWVDVGGYNNGTLF